MKSVKMEQADPEYDPFDESWLAEVPHQATFIYF